MKIYWKPSPYEYTIRFSTIVGVRASKPINGTIDAICNHEKDDDEIMTIYMILVYAVPKSDYVVNLRKLMDLGFMPTKSYSKLNNVRKTISVLYKDEVYISVVRIFPQGTLGIAFNRQFQVPLSTCKSRVEHMTRITADAIYAFLHETGAIEPLERVYEKYFKGTTS